MVGDIADLTEDNGRTRIGDMVEALGHRGFGPLLFIPAMLELSPIGGVPGVPTVLAAIITLIAVQIVFGRSHFWLPGFIAKRSIRDDAMRKASDVLHPIAKKMDRWFGGRLEWMLTPRLQRAAAVVVIIHCATVPPLEVIPFASSVPMLSVALIGLAMTARDGALMLAAFIWGACALIVASYLLIW